MANVMLVEGWGLHSLISGYLDTTPPPSMNELGWVFARGTGTSGRPTFDLSEDSETGKRYVSFVDSGSREDNTAIALSRGLPGNPRLIAAGFSVGGGWVGDNVGYLAAVGLAFSSSPIVQVAPGQTYAEKSVTVGRFTDGSLVMWEVIGSSFTNTLTISEADSGFASGSENWIEVVVDLDAKTAALWVNNRQVGTLTMTGSYPAPTYASVLIGCQTVTTYRSSPGQLTVGAVYAADERLGRCQVRTRRPTSDAAVEFSRSQGDSNASQVADPDGPDGDTTCVSSATSGAEDLYLSSDVIGLTNERIHAVAVTATARKEDIGNRSITPIIGQGAAVAAGEPAALQVESYIGTQSVFSLDPATGGDWTISGVQSSTFGARLTD